MLTAKGRETEVAKGLALGADAYVTKPFSTKDLVLHVRKQLLGRQRDELHGSGSRRGPGAACVLAICCSACVAPSSGDVDRLRCGARPPLGALADRWWLALLRSSCSWLVVIAFICRAALSTPYGGPAEACREARIMLERQSCDIACARGAVPSSALRRGQRAGGAARRAAGDVSGRSARRRPRSKRNETAWPR